MLYGHVLGLLNTFMHHHIAGGELDSFKGKSIPWDCPLCLKGGCFDHLKPTYIKTIKVKKTRGAVVKKRTVVPGTQCTLIDLYFMTRFCSRFNDPFDARTWAIKFLAPEQLKVVVKDERGQVHEEIRVFKGGRKQFQGWKKAVFAHICEQHGWCKHDPRLVLLGHNVFGQDGLLVNQEALDEKARNKLRKFRPLIERLAAKVGY